MKWTFEGKRESREGFFIYMKLQKLNMFVKCKMHEERKILKTYVGKEYSKDKGSGIHSAKDQPWTRESSESEEKKDEM